MTAHAHQLCRAIIQGNNSTPPVVEYYRPVLPHELAIDVRAEAEAHGCILAMKGAAVVIMPRLVPGWTQVSDKWRTM